MGYCNTFTVCTILAAIQLVASRSAVVSNLIQVEDQDGNLIQEEIDELFDVAESDQSSIERRARQNNPDYLPVRAGVGCGYLRMRGGQVVTIQSSNFRSGEYFNNEACVWKFFGHHCVLSAQCPCSDIPQSFGCLEDYLKITDTFLFNQRFCGDLKPYGSYQSATNNLKVRFRSDARDTAAGFMCFISCATPGTAEFKVPTNITCPVSSLVTTTLNPNMTTTGPGGSTSSPLTAVP